MLQVVLKPLPITVLLSISPFRSMCICLKYLGAPVLGAHTFMIWRRIWQLSPVFLPVESHGQRSLVGYSPWGCKELDMAEPLTHTSPIHGGKRQMCQARAQLIKCFHLAFSNLRNCPGHVGAAGTISTAQ